MRCKSIKKSTYRYLSRTCLLLCPTYLIPWMDELLKNSFVISTTLIEFFLTVLNLLFFSLKILLRDSRCVIRLTMLETVLSTNDKNSPAANSFIPPKRARVICKWVKSLTFKWPNKVEEHVENESLLV